MQSKNPSHPFVEYDSDQAPDSATKLLYPQTLAFEIYLHTTVMTISSQTSHTSYFLRCLTMLRFHFLRFAGPSSFTRFTQLIVMTVVCSVGGLRA